MHFGHDVSKTTTIRENIPHAYSLDKNCPQGSELLLNKDTWTDSNGSTPMPLGLGIMQLGLELINLITPSYQIKILTGYTVYIVMSTKSILMTFQSLLARLLSPLPPWMSRKKIINTPTTRGEQQKYIYDISLSILS